MNKWQTKVVVSGLALLLLGILGRLTHLFPFDPAVTRWSFQENYLQNKIPQESNLRQVHCARSPEGIVIGVEGPGSLEWHFARPGPFPTIVQPFFVPSPSQLARISLISPHHPEPRVLSHDLPLHNRPLDFSAEVKDESEMAIRLEGSGARLEDIRFFELSQNPPVPWAIGLIALLLFSFAIWKRNISALVLLGICLIGFYLRWDTFRSYFSLPLEGDATEYWSLGQTFQWMHPFMTGPREPGFIWMVHKAIVLFGNSIRSLRFLGVLLSVAWIPLTMELACAAGWPLWVGVVAAGLVATNPFAIFMSVQGYQLEFFTFLILLFAIAWVRNRSFWIGLLGGLLCVTRVQSFTAVLPLVALVAWRNRWDRRAWGRFLVPFILLTLPYLFAVRAQTGSVLGHLSRHAGYYDNVEAVGMGKSESVTTPGLVHFFFSPGQFHRRVLALFEGYGKIFFDPRDPYNRILLNSHYAQARNLIFFPFFCIGLVMMLKDPRDRWFLGLPLLFLGVLPMLHDLIQEPRLMFHIEPFVALIVARGLIKLAKRES